MTATRKHAALQAGSSAASYALRNDASLGALDRVAARLTAQLKSGQRAATALDFEALKSAVGFPEYYAEEAKYRL